MTLNEALAAVKGAATDPATTQCYLACGFEPLHLATFLQAHMLQRVPGERPEILRGLYGNLTGNISEAARSGAASAAVVIEWSDIDPRLGLRSSGGWGDTKSSILSSAALQLSQLEGALARAGAAMPVAVATPGLPLPPVGNTIRAQWSVFELELQQMLAGFLVKVAQLPGVRVVQPRAGAAERLDVRMELLAGFPYTNAYADELGGALAAVLQQQAPKKGLITDLDDTLWSGLVGEVGPDAVSWHQDSHTQIHGLYQQMLGQLAECGVLLGVCSKNELATAEAALGRTDLLVRQSHLFPVLANWGPKSASVAQVLRTWNIAEDSVVFVDDNAMEVEEVQRAFPAMTCLRFPAKNPPKVWELLGQLRDLFGKPLLTAEDGLRQASIRSSAQIEEMAAGAGSAEFLHGLDGVVSFAWGTNTVDKRPLELINKTNQFNLNGLRIGEAEWQRRMQASDTVLGVISYRDKFGPLGKIGVVLGSRRGEVLRVSHWVLSCRAFSRRIEHHTLAALFDTAQVEAIEFDYAATERNQPLQGFFTELGIGAAEAGRLRRRDWDSRSAELPHKVAE